MGNKRRKKQADPSIKSKSDKVINARWKVLKIPSLPKQSNADDLSTVYSVERLEGVKLRIERDSKGKDCIAEAYIDETKVDLASLVANHEDDSTNSDISISAFENCVHLDQFKQPDSHPSKLTKSKKIKRIDKNLMLEERLLTWDDLGLRDELIDELRRQNFDKPTDIQKAIIPVALSITHDIFGAAETGSGKTLAFSLPVLQRILNRRTHSGDSTDKDGTSNLVALIIEPTRELANQVVKILEQLSSSLNVKIARIIGGLSEDKQERIIKRNPDIVVATIGRLWSLLEKYPSFLQMVKNIDYLVVDEVDRMTEKGHFAELERLSAILFGNIKDSKSNKVYSTIVVSATLLDEVAVNSILSNDNQKQDSNGAIIPKKLAHILQKLRTRDKSPIYINMLNKSFIPGGIDENIIKCLEEEKDYYLYYILLKCSGRVIIFVNYIKKVKEIVSILSLLKLSNVKQLHSDMDQSKRLKSIEFFDNNEKTIMIATDIASRGLDIKNIEYIIHYDTPRSCDIYVHRCGRTARMGSSGVSVLLCSPREYHSFEKKSFIPGKGLEDLKEFNIKMNVMHDISERVELAKKIHGLIRSNQKVNTKRNWFEKAAPKLDIDLDPDFIISKKDKISLRRSRSNNHDDDCKGRSEEKAQRFKLDELKRLLKENLSNNLKV